VVNKLDVEKFKMRLNVRKTGKGRGEAERGRE
jgi:hypothetical protein